MARIELKMPKMGESIMEATILKWLKKEGELVRFEEAVLEIATDKVDSEVPSPVEGTIEKILFAEDQTVAVGDTIAWIQSGTNGIVKIEQNIESVNDTPPADSTPISKRFYSPLVKTIAKQEKITDQELASIEGSGSGGRVNKQDIINFIEQRGTPRVRSVEGEVEIFEMDRMRRLISEHMVMSKSTSPHVTSFVEVDVTTIVEWRNRIKDDFYRKFGEKITFTPIFIEAVVEAIKAFPMINISLDGTKIIKKNFINIGMATALSDGNLIVPVIKNADHLSLIGLTSAVNQLAEHARKNKLKPEDIQGGTFTVTNVGTFGNVMGTPIINQPQVAIMAIGAIRKKPAVVETEFGDLIAIRHLMFLSLSYDHRIVDGFLGGSFLRKVADLLEAFDPNRSL
jgi:2-oxoglutarate dehydrogenase E2 component (dihydrolipoamide succinyltransferase)